MSGIYTITNLVNGKIYVGYTLNLLKRKNQHLNDLKTNKHINRLLQRAYNKYGKKNIVFEILIECDKEYLLSEEHYWATLLNVHDPNYGYNLKLTHPYRNSGVVKKGFKHSEESKQLISNSLKGIKRVRTKEHTENWKISMSKVIKKLTEEGRQKIIETNKRKRPWFHKCIEQYDLNNNHIETFASLTEASIKTKLQKTNISACALNKAKTCGGYIWKYKNK